MQTLKIKTLALFGFWERAVVKVENLPIGIGTWLGTLAALAFLRTLLEGFSQRLYNFPSSERISFFFHAFGFYLFAFLGVILILRAVTGVRIEKVSKFILFVSVLILIPPILDLLATRGDGAIMGYRDLAGLNTIKDLPRIFGDFLMNSPFGFLFAGSDSNPIVQLGRNYGIRIEVLIELILFVWYIFLKTKSAIRMLFGTAAIYLGLFIVGGFPSIVAMIGGFPPNALVLNTLSALNLDLKMPNLILFSCFTLLITIQAIVWFYFYNKEKLLAVWSNSRYPRVVVNLFILFAGIYFGILGQGKNFSFLPLDWLVLISAGLSVLFYWIGAVAYNDIQDETGDKIAMPLRPLSTGLMSVGEMKIVAYLSWTASAIFGGIVGTPFLTILAARWCLGYLYSAKPFRLKSLPIISNLTLGLAYFCTFLAGYLVAPANKWESFPLRLAIGVIIWFTFASEFKDIKDHEGDRADGIKTLPVIFGLAESKKIIGLMGIFSFLSIALLYKEYFGILIWLSLGFGGLYYLLVNAMVYREQRIIYASLGFAVALMTLSIFKVITL